MREMMTEFAWVVFSNARQSVYQKYIIERVELDSKAALKFSAMP